MNPDPREPHDIAQEMLDDDTDAMEELLKDTELEDLDEEDFDYDLPIDEEPAFSEDDIDYF